MLKYVQYDLGCQIVFIIKNNAFMKSSCYLFLKITLLINIMVLFELSLGSVPTITISFMKHSEHASYCMENGIKLSPYPLLCKVGKVKEENTLQISINQYHLTQIQFKRQESGHGFGGVHIILCIL